MKRLGESLFLTVAELLNENGRVVFFKPHPSGEVWRGLNYIIR